MNNGLKISKAIQKINPDAQFAVHNNSIDQIIWVDGTSPISKSDIETKMIEVQTEYDAEEWKRNRKAEYPLLEDVTHALIDGGDTLTDLQAKRTAIKEKYPKP